jgi:flagellar biosynthesis protein FliR
MPLQIAAGLFILGLTIPFFASATQRVLNSLHTDIQALLRLM